MKPLSFCLPTSVLIALSVFGSVACSDAPERNSDDERLGPPMEPGAILFDSTPVYTKIWPCEDGDSRDSLTVKEFDIVGTEAVFQVEHSGGCETHTYGLCYSKEWAESEPVQIGLEVLHDDGGDTCEAGETVTLSFSLGQLEAAYKEAYQSEGGTVALSIAGFSQSYAFGPAPTTEELDASIEELNSCDTTEDCQAVSVGCSSRYISADTSEQERSALESKIRLWSIEENGSDQIACTDDCQCGVLTCMSNKCVASAGTCENVGEGEMSICL